MNRFEKIAKSVVGDARGTIEVHGNYLILRKMVNQIKVSQVESEASVMVLVFKSSIGNAIRDITGDESLHTKVRLDDLEPTVAGFRQGAYIECFVLVDIKDVDISLWDVAAVLEKKGLYRVKA